MFYTGGAKMLKIHKNIIIDENRNPIAVQIPFEDFKHIEEIIENYGLSKMINEAKDDERFSVNEAKKYYQSLKDEC
jgi:hypothetical protein